MRRDRNDIEQQCEAYLCEKRNVCIMLIVTYSTNRTEHKLQYVQVLGLRDE